MLLKDEIKKQNYFFKDKKKQPKSTWEDSLNPWFRLWDWNYLIEENKITKIISQLIKIERIKLEKKKLCRKRRKNDPSKPGSTWKTHEMSHETRIIS
jgi:hypothetical protein